MPLPNGGIFKIPLEFIWDLIKSNLSNRDITVYKEGHPLRRRIDEAIKANQKCFND